MAGKLTPLLLGTKVAATGATTAGLFGSAGAFGLTQTLMTVGKVGSVLMGMQQSRMQAAALEDQATDEKIRANEESIARREKLIETLAMNNAKAGASGILNVGTPENIKETDIKRFEDTEKRAGLASKVTQNSLRRQAKTTKTGGTLGAAISLVDYGTNIRNTG